MKYVIKKKSKSHLKANEKAVFDSIAKAIKDWFLQKTEREKCKRGIRRRRNS